MSRHSTHERAALLAASMAALGLAGCGGSDAGSAAYAAQPQAMRSDVFEVELAPFENMEYKYELAEGAGMSFSWSAPAPVYYDMHSEDEDAPPGTAETFEIGTADRQDGVYVAPFTGIHGWFWENRGATPVTVTLRSAGFYTGAVVISGGGEEPREIPEAR